MTLESTSLFPLGGFGIFGCCFSRFSSDRRFRRHLPDALRRKGRDPDPFGRRGYAYRLLNKLGKNIYFLCIQNASRNEHIVHGARRLCADRHPVLYAILYECALLATRVIEADALHVFARLGPRSVLGDDNAERGLIDAPHSLHSDFQHSVGALYQQLLENQSASLTLVCLAIWWIQPLRRESCVVVAAFSNSCLSIKDASGSTASNVCCEISFTSFISSLVAKTLANI